MKRLFYFLFKSLLALSLIFLGLKGLSDVNTNKAAITKTIESFEMQVLIPYNLNTNLNLLKQHPVEILYFENLCLIYGGFLFLFGLSLSSTFLTVSFMVEFILVNNIYFKRDERTLMDFSILLSILGGILSINKN